MRFGPDFDALIASFSPNLDAPIAIAVSGGSDSIALLSMAHDWSLQTGRALSVLTVDHGLRPDSVAEAKKVSALSHALGLAHTTLSWGSPKASQNAARKARYQLLADAAQSIGASVLMTGHTFDDVVETALLRRRRGVRTTAVIGPNLVSPIPAWPQGRGVTLLRPLIHTRRSELQRFLEARAQRWVEDPSNQNPKFERARIRSFLKRHPRLGALAAEFVADLQEAAVQDHQNLSASLARVRVRPSGMIDTADAPVTPALMQVLSRCASGAVANPRYGAVKELMSALESPGARRTLNGAWFQKKTQGVCIGRDPGAKIRKSDTIFDGRFVKDPSGQLPLPQDLPFLMRETAPSGPEWREIISERLAHINRCYQTPLLRPVQR